MLSLRTLREEGYRLLHRVRERRCDRRLRSALAALASASTSRLTEAAFIEDLIRAAGLVHDSRGLYGPDDRFMNDIPRGLWQIPRQLAEFLVWVSQYEIRSFLEIGTHTGYTFAFTLTYLRRFNPDIQGTTIDPYDAQPLKLSTSGGQSARYLRTTSQALTGQTFDLCLIDGDHAYHAVLEDFQSIGRFARLCAFHDINDEIVERYPGNDGGVPRLWRELKANTDDRVMKEFCFHPNAQRVMGIGVAVERQAWQSSPA